MPDYDCQLEIDEDEVNSKIPALPLEHIGPLVPNILFQVSQSETLRSLIVHAVLDMVIF